MTGFAAPLADIRFALRTTAGLDQLALLDGLETADAELVDAVLNEAAKFAANVVAPTNIPGDRAGAQFENGVVRTPGFDQVYRQFCQAGWNGVPFAPELGGGGLPWAVATAIQEMMASANLAFALCPMLTQGAVEAIEAHGSAEQQALYLEKLISGQWTGTMNLTEPQAGSDVGALKTRAVPAGHGLWKIKGTKIFITYGEHDLAENIIHLVLARTPNSPAGTRGISLFLVPKYLVDADGRLQGRNDVRCASIEHKLGIHASPTCVMSFGDEEGAIGQMLGPERGGMRCMFTMMNAARLAVGVQGLAVAERAYQQAHRFALQRLQGRLPGDPAEVSRAIIHHPDVRRMLMLMRSQTEAMRALLYFDAAAIDWARHHGDPKIRAEKQALADLLTPISKAWCTEKGSDLTALGIQVHGGMGFIEDTGAAQHYRDVKITTIYEGTTGIQANDLVARKLPMQGGAVVRGLLVDMGRDADDLARQGAELKPLGAALGSAVLELEKASAFMLDAMANAPLRALAGATPYLQLFGTVLGGWLLAKQASASRGEDEAFAAAKLATSRFYAAHVLSQAESLKTAATVGAEVLSDMPEAAFAAD